MKALWFSGGKDSVACLLLHEAELADIHVLWANTGKYLPEHVAFVEQFRARCPNWHEVRTDQAAQNAANGLPADVVPIRFTAFGESMTARKDTRIQDFYSCCMANISGPLWKKTLDLGCDTVIRGQRSDESHRAPCRHGDSLDGVTFHHPIETWTAQQTLEFVRERIRLPEFYALEHTSIDCYDCTAFLAHSEDRAAYLKTRHPTQYRQFIDRLNTLQAVLDSEVAPMRRILAHV